MIDGIENWKPDGECEECMPHGECEISQTDELRTLAGGLRKLYKSSANLTRVQVAGMATAVEAMREAADTIENLQDRLQAVGEMSERVSHTVVATSMALTNGECGECGECSEAGDYDELREEGESDEHVRRQLD